MRSECGGRSTTNEWCVCEAAASKGRSVSEGVLSAAAADVVDGSMGYGRTNRPKWTPLPAGNGVRMDTGLRSGVRVWAFNRPVDQKNAVNGVRGGGKKQQRARRRVL